MFYLKKPVNFHEIHEREFPGKPKKLDAFFMAFSGEPAILGLSMRLSLRFRLGCNGFGRLVCRNRAECLGGINQGRLDEFPFSDAGGRGNEYLATCGCSSWRDSGGDRCLFWSQHFLTIDGNGVCSGGCCAGFATCTVSGAGAVPHSGGIGNDATCRRLLCFRRDTECRSRGLLLRESQGRRSKSP